jgi:hypothetical protein
MKYEDLPEDIKADLPTYLLALIDGVKTHAQICTEIENRLNG